MLFAEFRGSRDDHIPFHKLQDFVDSTVVSGNLSLKRLPLT